MRLAPVEFASLVGAKDGFAETFALFQQTARHVLTQNPPLRTARAPDAALMSMFSFALEQGHLTEEAARGFFERHFQPFAVEAEAPGFVTGYYEPEVEGALQFSAEFSSPVLARPDDLVTLSEPSPVHGGVMALRRGPDGVLGVYPSRAEIESGAVRGLRPLVYLRDAVEVFLVQVQGSARVRLPGGRLLRLRYDGRNGRAYTSIGRILIENGHIRQQDMSLAALKAWVRAHDLAPGGLARQIMHRNESYVFFAMDESLATDEGPIGGAGVPLTALRSLAVDRTIWSYGLPFWISASLPWKGNGAESFGRLMLAQDTGSAIVGAARGDIFFGTGESAGYHAGNIRHPAHFTVLLPKS